MRTVIIFILALFAITPLATGQILQSKDIKAPVPDWISAQEPVAADETQFAAVNGQHWLLIDNQFRNAADGSHSYARRVVKAETIQGVERSANFRWKYDPLFQEMKVHYITIHRDGETIDALATAHIEILRQESRLSRNVYDGDETLYIRLVDVQPGDIIDSASSRIGENPAYGGNFARTYTTEWSQPIERQYMEISWDAESKVGVSAGDAPVHRSNKDGRQSVSLGPRPVHRQRPETGAPIGMSVFNTLRVSSFDGWEEVVEINAPYYEQYGLGPRGQAIVDQIKSEHTTTEDRLTAAIRFVQDEIRYQAVSLGTGGWIPNDPEHVLDVRYGDCKDKTTLLNLLLRDLGVGHAHAALVHTRQGAGLAEKLPSMGVFNHVISVVEHDGQRYWIDATRKMQGGRFGTIAQPFFHHALILRDGEQNLTKMAYPQNGAFRVEKSATLDLSAGAEQSVRLIEHNVYFGAAADSMRRQYAARGIDNMNDRKLRSLEGLFGDVEIHAPTIVNDDRDSGRVEIISEFELSEPYLVPINEALDGGEIEWVALQNVTPLSMRATRTRTLPLAIRHTVNLAERVAFVMPAGIDPISVESNAREAVIANDAFIYEKRKRVEGNTLIYESEIKALTSQIEPDTAIGVFRDARRMRAFNKITLLIPKIESEF